MFGCPDWIPNLMIFVVYLALLNSVRGSELDGTEGDIEKRGLTCWDLNGNGKCDLLEEDFNNDTLCDTTDCEGPPPFGCWDLNQDGHCNRPEEDKDGDGNCSDADCL